MPGRIHMTGACFPSSAAFVVLTCLILHSTCYMLLSTCLLHLRYYILPSHNQYQYPKMCYITRYCEYYGEIRLKTLKEQGSIIMKTLCWARLFWEEIDLKGKGKLQSLYLTKCITLCMVHQFKYTQNWNTYFTLIVLPIHVQVDPDHDRLVILGMIKTKKNSAHR